MPEDVDEILRAFPGPVTLYQSRNLFASIWFKLVLFGAIFLCLTAVLTLRLSGVSNTHAAFLISITLAALTTWLFYAFTRILGPPSMTMDHQGFEYRSGRLSKIRRWSEVTPFTVRSFGRGSVHVCFEDLAPTSKLSWAFRRLRGGHTFSCSFDLSVDDFARLLNRWRNRAIGA